jgi:hypothetical protein
MDQSEEHRHLRHLEDPMVDLVDPRMRLLEDLCRLLKCAELEIPAEDTHHRNHHVGRQIHRHEDEMVH